MRKRPVAFKESYVAVLANISFRTIFMTLVGPVLARPEFVGRLIGSKFGIGKGQV
jgi:hypothetical protein